jgi:hypothetical protein
VVRQSTPVRRHLSRQRAFTLPIRVREVAGIEFPGWDPSTSFLVAEVEMSEAPELASAATTRASIPLAGWRTVSG